MQIDKQNFLTALLFGAFTLLLFYGYLFECPSKEDKPRIHTIHLNVRLDSIKPSVKALKNLSPKIKATEELIKNEKARNSLDPLLNVKERENPQNNAGNSQLDYTSRYVEDIEVPLKTVEEIEDPSQTVEEIEDPPQTFEEIEPPSQTVEEIEDPSQIIEKIEDPSQIIEEFEDPSETDEEIEDPSQPDEEIEDPSQIIEEIEDPSQTVEEIEDPSQTFKEIEDPSQTFEEIEPPSQTVKEIEYPSQIIEEIEDPSRTVEEIEHPAQTVEDIESPPQIVHNSEDVHGLQLNVKYLQNPSHVDESEMLVDNRPSIAVNSTKSLRLQSSSKNKTDSFERERYFMVFLVPSTPDGWRFRQSMRTRWLNQSCWRGKELEGVNAHYLNFKLMFIIGRRPQKNYSQAFLEEVSQNDDMYLIDLPESRKILKDKVLFGMKESIKRFDYNFLIKFDHDSFVDLPRLSSGISSLPKENLLAGSCRFRIWTENLNRTIHYCSGGAYILSQDLVVKIAGLSETETNVTLGKQEPEDVYIGYLVSVVQEKFNITGLRPKHQMRIVNRYSSKSGHYWFKTWFLHFLKGWDNMERAFNCRVTADVQTCPTKHFSYKDKNSTQCDCLTRQGTPLLPKF